MATAKKAQTIANGRKSRAVPGAVVGAPTKYKPEYVDLAYKFCLMGATDARLAELFEVSVDTIYQWKNTHPEFSESIFSGRDKADAEIANSLYHRAKGYSHKEVDIKMYQGEIIQTEVVKHYPPDTAAASLWLRNRQGGRWREKVEVDQKTELTATVDVTLSPDEAYLRLIGK